MQIYASRVSGKLGARRPHIGYFVVGELADLESRTSSSSSAATLSRLRLGEIDLLYLERSAELLEHRGPDLHSAPSPLGVVTSQSSPRGNGTTWHEPTFGEVLKDANATFRSDTRANANRLLHVLGRVDALGWRNRGGRALRVLDAAALLETVEGTSAALLRGPP